MRVMKCSLKNTVNSNSIVNDPIVNLKRSARRSQIITTLSHRLQFARSGRLNYVACHSNSATADGRVEVRRNFVGSMPSGKAWQSHASPEVGSWPAATSGDCQFSCVGNEFRVPDPRTRSPLSLPRADLEYSPFAIAQARLLWGDCVLAVKFPQHGRLVGAMCGDDRRSMMP
jgi:hypothetical protein